MGIKQKEALEIWKWIRWRLPNEIRLEAEERIKAVVPTPTDPELAGYLDTLQNGREEEKRLALRELVIILNSPNTPPPPGESGK